MEFTQLKEFEERVLAADRKLQYTEGQRKIIEGQISFNKAKIIETEEQSDVFLKAATLLQQVSEKTREKSVTRIETIVTQAVQEVYGDKALQFKIIFDNRKGGAVTVDFRLWDSNLNQYMDLVHSEAGGIRNIIATILRLVVIDLCYPRIEGPVVLDEIGVHISEEYQERFGKFLQQYSQLTGRQIILVSHIDKVKIHADKKIKLQRTGIESELINE